MIQTQVAIIGAGPIGLELAAALKRTGVDYVQIDAGQVGQTISWYPQQAKFFSGPERIAIAGTPLHTADQSKATREEYLAYLRSIVDQFDLHVNTYERVLTIDREPDGFILRTQRGGERRAYSARYVVMAIGDMHGPRRLHIPGEDLQHVSHYFEEPHRYFRQRLLIVGGRNSAIEAALRCYHAGAKVTISYRQPAFDEKSVKYWLLPELKSLIKHGQIQFLPCTQPMQITHNEVVLASSRDSECGVCDDRTDRPTQRVPADFVLLLTGYVMDTTLFENAGVELLGENRSPRHDPETMESNVPGLFIAGTAAAGTQVHFRLFIENCHQHVTKIVKAITGKELPAGFVNEAAKKFALPES